MPKRQASDADIDQPARAKGEGKPVEDGGMGEFEDQWEDEMSEEEVVEGDLEAEDGE
jgi:ribosome assembly protein RRB1